MKLEKIKSAFRKFKELVIGIGIGAALMALFTGHIFISVVIGGLVYLFWRNEKGQEEFIGTAAV